VSDKVLDLRKCNYSGKNLSGKTLAGALLSETDMSNTNLTEAVLTKVCGKPAVTLLGVLVVWLVIQVPGCAACNCSAWDLQ
jgi:hypothetical protein